MCPTCVDRLHSELRGVVDAYRESEHALTPTPTRTAERVSGSRSVGIVLDDRAVSARSRTTELLASWARMVVDERGVLGPGASEVATLVRFLREHLDWLATHPAAADFDEEMADLLECVTSALEPNPTRHLALGDCPRPDCGGALRGVLHAVDDDHAPGLVVCESGHRLPPRQWLEIADRLRPVTTGEAR
ncbi:OvmZ protein [Streptomyces sp. TRM43335]|uniref:OvmZ protein n=1 Tax=Streptomyces taklimakanensis TaxID=2569853 RepID=A0A6G2BFF3_9ACTN|nr:OvmZ protein [Streptomyces taklimakanensis]MTE21011.1 OvmZ protein [Streptomyces taklimakanensis]